MRRAWIGLIAVGAFGCSGEGTSLKPIVTKSATVVAGGETPGATDGAVASATFNNPVNVAVAPDGTVYVSDFDNNRVRRIRDGQVTTVVAQENFQRPFGIAVSSNGTVYVQTDANPEGARDGTTGTIWRLNTVAGGATPIAANLGRPRGLTVLSNGTIAYSNLTGNTVHLLNPETGTPTLLAGSGAPGFAEGNGAAAQFNRPYGLTALPNGNLLVADQNNHRIRQITPGGAVTTFAGTGTAGASNGPLATATLNGPQDVDRAPDGRIFIADTTGKLIRSVANGQMSTFAGDGTAGFAEGSGSAVRFFGLEGIAVSPDGRYVYAADGSGG